MPTTKRCQQRFFVFLKFLLDIFWGENIQDLFNDVWRFFVVEISGRLTLGSWVPPRRLGYQDISYGSRDFGWA